MARVARRHESRPAAVFIVAVIDLSARLQQRSRRAFMPRSARLHQRRVAILDGLIHICTRLKQRSRRRFLSFE